MSERIEIRTLTDGGQRPADVARVVAEFLDGAQRTLDLAQYDFHLAPETASIVGDALRRAHARSARARRVYSRAHETPTAPPPPRARHAAHLATARAGEKATSALRALTPHEHVTRESHSL